jgi:hypothetical protein
MWAVTEQRHAQDRLASLHWINGATERDRNNDDLKALHHFLQALALADNPNDKRNAYLAADLLAGSASLVSILQPQGGVQTAVFANDSPRIVTWSPRGVARVWDVRTARYDEAPRASSSRVLAAHAWCCGSAMMKSRCVTA